jgi:DNA-binding transcriptional MerR regulator
MKFKWVYVGSKDIAELFGVTERSIHDWVKEGRIRKISRGLYDPVDVARSLRQSYENKIKELRSGGGALSEIELESEKQKLIILSAKAAEVQMKVVNADDVERMGHEFMSHLRNRLLALPKQLIGNLSGTPEQKKAIFLRTETLIHEYLNDLASLPERISEPAGGDKASQNDGISENIPDADASTKPHRKRMGGKAKTLRTEPGGKVA